MSSRTIAFMSVLTLLLLLVVSCSPASAPDTGESTTHDAEDHAYEGGEPTDPDEWEATAPPSDHHDYEETDS